jgi:ribosomal protein L6P/L9E
MLSRNRLKEVYILQIPDNLNIFQLNSFLIIKNKEKSYELQVKLVSFLHLNFLHKEKILEVSITESEKTSKYAQSMLITYSSKLKHQLKGVSELYHGVINIKGVGYSVNITKKGNAYNLFFRFGFKDTYNYLMPTDIIINNPDTAKSFISISSYSIERLKQIQRDIQLLRYPKAFKLQGIYLNNNFPKVKKYTK